MPARNKIVGMRWDGEAAMLVNNTATSRRSASLQPRRHPATLFRRKAGDFGGGDFNSGITRRTITVQSILAHSSFPSR